MGAIVNVTNRIEIGNEAKNGVVNTISYKQLNIDEVITNTKINVIQISQSIDEDAYKLIDRILEKRKDITFRIYGLYKEEYFDLKPLEKMAHLTRLQLEANLSEYPEMLDFARLTHLPNLKSLILNVYRIKDFSFVNDLPSELEEFELLEYARDFDCQYLLKYQKLHRLSLSHCHNNIQMIGQLPLLQHLTLDSIQLSSFDFLKQCPMESFVILLGSVADFASIKELKSLKYLELYRMDHLEDISCLASLKHLETLKLNWMYDIKEFPDLSACISLKEIILMNVNIKHINQKMIPYMKFIS